MKKTKRRTWRRTAQPIQQCCGMRTFREDFDIDFLDKLAELGCLDAPDVIPAGSCFRFINVDTVAEKIEGWPATTRARREANE